MIVDANVLVSALLGRSLPLLIDVRSRGWELFIPSHQYRECRLIVGQKGGLHADAFDNIAATLVETLPLERYLDCEAAARARLGQGGQPDWPILAAALALEDDIWSNDRDFFGVGVPVWTTRNIGFVDSPPGASRVSR